MGPSGSRCVSCARSSRAGAIETLLAEFEDEQTKNRDEVLSDIDEEINEEAAAEEGAATPTACRGSRKRQRQEEGQEKGKEEEGEGAAAC